MTMTQQPIKHEIVKTKPTNNLGINNLKIIKKPETLRTQKIMKIINKLIPKPSLKKIRELGINNSHLTDGTLNQT